MKSWTGTEKLTRGWWVNNGGCVVYSDPPFARCQLGDVFWTNGLLGYRAPFGRELVGFVVRWCQYGTKLTNAWYITANGHATAARYIFDTYAAARLLVPSSGHYRIRPVTRRKRKAAAPSDSYMRDVLEATYRKAISERRAFDARCGVFYREAMRPKPIISLSDALSDQLRGCLRVGKDEWRRRNG